MTEIPAKIVLLAVSSQGVIIGWRHILLTYLSGEGVTCLQIFKWQTLTIIFHKNTLSLNELIRYVKSTYSNKIWPEHPSSIKEQNYVRN